MRRLEALLPWVLTPVVLAAVAWGAALAEEPDEGDEALDPRRPGTTHGASPVPLPGGFTLDPQTMRLVGPAIDPYPGTRLLRWEDLEGYVYQPGLDNLPEALRALDGQGVTMVGFLVPLYAWEDITEFNLVSSHWACCFGMPAGLDGTVYVHLTPGETGFPNTLEPIKIAGTFRVAERKEAGYTTAIFAIEDAKGEVMGWR